MAKHRKDFPEWSPRLQRLYVTWQGMMRRTNPKEWTNKPSYIGVSVSAAFHSFKDFASWGLAQVGGGLEGFHLDKDLLADGNKVYSPETCVFLPKFLNAHLTNNQRTRPRGLPLGVDREKCGRFAVRMNIENVRTRVGMFATAEDAFKAYKVAKEENYKRMAVKFQDQIDPRAFVALMTRTQPDMEDQK